MELQKSSSDLQIRKKLLRKEMLSLRSDLSAGVKQRFDEMVCDNLQQIVVDRNPSTIHCYIPMKDEVNVLPFIKWALEKKIQVVCPKVAPERELISVKLAPIFELEQGVFNTFHPKGNGEFTGGIDLIVVPGLAFDSSLNRLGYGGGYYDRFLVKHPESFKVAVQYPFQIVSEVPTEKHDVKVDYLIYS